MIIVWYYKYQFDEHLVANILLCETIYAITMQDTSKFISIFIVFVSFIILISVNDSLFGEIHSQPTQQTSGANTITINLMDGSDNPYQEGATTYMKVKSIQTNVSSLQGMEAGSGYTYGSAADDTITISFPAKVPDPQNPNKVNVLDVNIRLGVNSIETKSDGSKIYYGESGFFSNTIGDFHVTEGDLEQTSKQEAVFTLKLEP